MLSKMGFEKGKGIGRNGAGTLNPLGIHVRTGARAGLGVEEEVHRLAEEQFQRQAAEANEMRNSFLARQRTNFETKQVSMLLNLGCILIGIAAAAAAAAAAAGLASGA